MAIPRVIHQTYSSRERLHPDLHDNMERLAELNPGWTHRFHDDEAILAFIRQEYSADMLRYYLRINPRYGPARADFFRYLLMYRVGGVYLDVKATLTRRLDDVLRADDVYLLSHWQNQPGQDYGGWGIHPECDPVHGEWQQWHVVCAPNHPFLKAVILEVIWNIDNYRPARDGVGKSAVLRVTGPIAYTNAIEPIRLRYPDREVDIRSHLGFEYSLFDLNPTPGAFDSYFSDHYELKYEPLVLPEPAPELSAAPKLLQSAL
jgi:mannosyltransferase OCH1-like enzyme